MTDFEKKIEEFVVDIYKINGIKFGQYVLKSGITSPIYFDLRVIVSHPKLMVKLSDLLTELMEMKNLRPQTICGVPYTALPIATLVSTSTVIPMVVRRKEAKSYGTGRTVEGEFASGASCVIIEDVISTGSSILETAQDLELAGLKVEDAIVVLDREQGAVINLEAAGIRPHVLLSLSQLLAILFCRGHITQQIVADVKRFVAQKQTYLNGPIMETVPKKNPRLSSTFATRAEGAKHPLAKRLLLLMERKESLLCVAADVTSSAELINVAEEIGPFVAVLKTHVDAIADFTPITADRLVQIAAKHNFIILEDRKFADIGNTVRLQYGVVQRWAELVTAHSITGPSIIAGLKKGAGSEPRGVFLIAELSSDGTLIGPNYAKETIKMAEEAQDTVVGVVSQTGDLLQVPSLLQLTPGIWLSETKDELGQQYVDPRSAVLEKGADLVVVGRGILDSPNRAVEAEKYKALLWEAYMARVG